LLPGLGIKTLYVRRFTPHVFCGSSGRDQVMNKTHRIAYWLTTTLVAAELALGGVWDVLRILYVRSVIEHLGYPSYFLVIIGAWKVPGALALVVPRFPWLKEWAYAGLVFNYTGAAASHLAVGDGASTLIAPVVFMGLTLASWALRPPSRMALVL
jgi:DoxX-like family